MKIRKKRFRVLIVPLPDKSVWVAYGNIRRAESKLEALQIKWLRFEPARILFSREWYNVIGSRQIARDLCYQVMLLPMGPMYCAGWAKGWPHLRRLISDKERLISDVMLYDARQSEWYCMICVPSDSSWWRTEPASDYSWLTLWGSKNGIWQCWWR